jgi:hypothetical protein
MAILFYKETQVFGIGWPYVSVRPTNFGLMEEFSLKRYKVYPTGGHATFIIVINRVFLLLFFKDL